MPIQLKRSQGDLLHRQLFLALREQIRRGIYPAGSAIPPEDELCRLFGVSRITVRRSVGELVDAGFLERRLGRGTYVRAHGDKPHKRTSLTFVESLMQHSRQTKVKVLEMELRIPPVEINERLGLDGATPALFISRQRAAGSTPLMVIDAWLISRLAVLVTAKRLRSRGLSETLIAHGVNYYKVMQGITAVSADPHVASLLNVEIGAPLIRLVRVIYESPNVPVLHVSAYLTSERSSIISEYHDVLGSREGGRLVHHVFS